MNDYNFEVVQSFKCFESTVNVANELHEELKTRTVWGSRCFYALNPPFRNNLLNTGTKYRLHKTLVRSAINYVSETWNLTVSQENRLRCFKKIQRSISRPVKVGDILRIRTRAHLHFRCRKYSRSNQSSKIAHMTRMNDDRVTKKVLVSQFDGTRLIWRPRKRWIDFVEGELRELGIRNWKVVPKDRRVSQNSLGC